MTVVLLGLAGLLTGSVLAWLAVHLPKPYLQPQQISTLSPVSFVPVLGWRRTTPYWILFGQIGTMLIFALLAYRIEIAAARVVFQNVPLFLAACCLYAAVLMLILLTDYLYKLILTAVSLPASGVALVLAAVVPDFNLMNALLGGAIFFVLFLALYYLAKFLYRDRGIVPFGAGDVRLALFIGLALGLPAATVAILTGMILAGLAGAGIVLITRSARGVLPYGVPLCLAALVVLAVLPQALTGN